MQGFTHRRPWLDMQRPTITIGCSIIRETLRSHLTRNRLKRHVSEGCIFLWYIKANIPHPPSTATARDIYTLSPRTNYIGVWATIGIPRRGDHLDSNISGYIKRATFSIAHV